MLILDSSSPEFVALCEANPALYTRCSYQAMEQWSENSMMKVPQMFLAPGELLKDNRRCSKSEIEVMHFVKYG